MEDAYKKPIEIATDMFIFIAAMSITLVIASKCMTLYEGLRNDIEVNTTISEANAYTYVEYVGMQNNTIFDGEYSVDETFAMISNNCEDYNIFIQTENGTENISGRTYNGKSLSTCLKEGNANLLMDKLLGPYNRNQIKYKCYYNINQNGNTQAIVFVRVTI